MDPNLAKLIKLLQDLPEGTQVYGYRIDTCPHIRGSKLVSLEAELWTPSNIVSGETVEKPEKPPGDDPRAGKEIPSLMSLGQKRRPSATEAPPG